MLACAAVLAASTLAAAVAGSANEPFGAAVDDGSMLQSVKDVQGIAAELSMESNTRRLGGEVAGADGRDAVSESKDSVTTELRGNSAQYSAAAVIAARSASDTASRPIPDPPAWSLAPLPWPQPPPPKPVATVSPPPEPEPEPASAPPQTPTPPPPAEAEGPFQLQGPPPRPLDTEPPAGLSSVSAALGQDGRTQVVLSNLAAITDDAGVASFHVLYGTSDKPATATQVNAGPGALQAGEYTLTGLSAGTKYYLWTMAADAAGNVAGPTPASPPSLITNAAPAAPVGGKIIGRDTAFDGSRGYTFKQLTDGSGPPGSSPSGAAAAWRYIKSGHFSVAIWFTPNSHGVVLLTTGIINHSAANFDLRVLDSPEGFVQSVVYCANNSIHTILDNRSAPGKPAPIVPGRRYLVVFTVDSAGKPMLYVDGRAVENNSRPQARFPASYWSDPLLLPELSSVLGRRTFNGTVHELKVTPAALTADEVSAMYAEGPGSSEPADAVAEVRAADGKAAKDGVGSWTAPGVHFDKYPEFKPVLAESDQAAGDGFNDVGTLTPTAGPPANLQADLFGVFKYSRDFTFWILARPRNFFVSGTHQYHQFHMELGSGTSEADWEQAALVMYELGQADMNSHGKQGQPAAEIGYWFDSRGRNLTRASASTADHSLIAGYRVFAVRQRLSAGGGTEAGRVVISGEGGTASYATYTSPNPPISPTGETMRVSFLVSARMMPHFAEFAWRDRYMTDAEIFADARQYLAARNSNPK